MKIQSSNFNIQPDVSKYPEQLQMLIDSRNYFVISTVMSSSLSVPMTWLSMVTKRRDVSKEHHILFVEEIKKVEESVNLKVEALKFEMSKEVAKIEQNYSSLHGKVDIIVDAIKKLVEYYTFFSTKLDAMTETYSKLFAKMEEFLESLKESMSKINLSHSSSISQESM
ncbi:unnamed protein product [Lactuca saligna]|uniref:Uncharacterized protein n=1 Tax=Lactuca saligna TaxID=75948 RepID=A0AA35VCU3_LACSI|nr:unnamed protein product [Lactuca saligna]